MSKPAALALLATTQVAVLSLWFATAAAGPSLAAEFRLTPGRLSLLVAAVSAGFALGSVVSAVTGLADRVDPRRLYAASALAGALASLWFILLADPASPLALILRIATGAAMAGVYPIGMKIAVSWADRDRGLLVGLLVGALTLGSASPHLFAVAGGVDWRPIMWLSTAAAFAGAVAILFVRMGPGIAPTTRFEPRMALLAVRDRALRLANLGYLGHMWELYAVWGSIAAYLAASFAAHDAMSDPRGASVAAFAVVGIGALGALGGGYLADRIGRTATTIGALLVSGACCLVAGAVFGGPPGLVVAVCLVWGVSVIADSAQFSATVSELSPPGLTGTMLTVQTAAGFALTLATVQLVPLLADRIGWNWAFAPLAIGPLVGAFAMWRLRGLPAASRLANGRR
ncbi:MAG: MFS transporter [Bauldia sp.]|nr:MFS transporter [Bauldia sp.]